MSIDELREKLGTAPDTEVQLKTIFYRGVSVISVELYDYCRNPYKAMFNMVTSTWGKKINKWPDITPENRFLVVKALLEFKALPGAMEHPTFCFGIEGCSRSAFDQIARARVGVVLASMGWRDNDHSDIGFRIPEHIWVDDTMRKNMMEVCLKAKQEYHEMVSKGKSNWQDARAVLPISAIHRFSMSMNYLALRGFCSKRLKMCEQSDTVAVAWLVRKRVKEVFPLLGSYLKPSCDGKGVCEYHQLNEMSEAFGCLFRSCGRNPDLNPDKYATFNYACSDLETISEQLQMKIPNVLEDLPVIYYENLSGSDKELFEEE